MDIFEYLSLSLCLKIGTISDMHLPPPPLRITKKHHKHLNNPFPPSPRSLTSIHGVLSSNHTTLPTKQVFPIGRDFHLCWTSTKGSSFLSISHRSQPNRTLWSTIPGESFVSAAIVHTEVEESRGSFVVNDGRVHAICKHQSVERIGVFYKDDLQQKWHDQDDFILGFPLKNPKNDTFDDVLKEMQSFPICIITGRVFTKKKVQKLVHGGRVRLCQRMFRIGRTRKPSISARYWVLFYQKNCAQIGFHVKFGEISRQSHPRFLHKDIGIRDSPRRKLIRGYQKKRSGFFLRSIGRDLPSEDEGKEEDDVVMFGFNRVLLTYSSDADEKFFGFGEQFSHVEFKGKKVPILVQEQGIGRGDQPITFAANLVSHRAGGDWSTTYAPSPFYMTSKMRSMYLEGYDYSVFDLTEPHRVQIQIHSDSVRGGILHGDSPTELLERYTDIVGRPPKLPNWLISGAIIGMQGGTEAVRRVWYQLQDHDVPISAFWLQDWVGERKTMIGSQLWWNWELDSDRYNEWPELVKELRSSGIRVMAYCNPCLAPTDVKPKKNRNMFEEASKLGILVKDRTGSTYMIPNTAFDVGMLDFTHPSAISWFKNILHDMVDCGIRGWMADFGEGLPVDAVLHSGENSISAHNRYADLWARVNREFIDEWRRSNCHGKEEEENQEESLVFFMRAGFRGCPNWAMLFWEGDQMVSWQNNDGIKSSVVGLLSSGLSGIPFNHSDIGGYCAADLGLLLKYNRSEELLIRWMELNAFNTVFRTHEGNRPTSNCQFYSNDTTLSNFARFAKIYKAWMFYRVQLIQEASIKGLPVTRHLFLHYPDDEHVHGLSYEQFLVGSEILVAPVLDKGKKEVKVYFPIGVDGCSWQHIWTGKVFGMSGRFSGVEQRGFEDWVEAPIGFPAVFVKVGSPVGESFLKNLRELDVL